jgi:hypothetical protein
VITPESYQVRHIGKIALSKNRTDEIIPYCTSALDEAHLALGENTQTMAIMRLRDKNMIFITGKPAEASAKSFEGPLKVLFFDERTQTKEVWRMDSSKMPNKACDS